MNHGAGTVRKSNRITTNCLECDQAIFSVPSRIAAGAGKFCSRRCVGKAKYRLMIERHGPQTGERNPNYKGARAKTKLMFKRQFRERYPEKARAHDAVKEALKQGKLVRAPCADCGSTTRVHAHHEDYGKPLDVVWVCDKHHRIRHGAKS